MAESTNKIWVYIDHYQGTALPGSWEILGAGKELAKDLGGGVSALVFGHQVGNLVEEAESLGADEIFCADDETLKDFRPEPYASLLAHLARSREIEVILFPTTTRGRELAGMVGVDLETGVLPDVVALEPNESGIQVTRPVYAGKLLAKVQCLTRPQIITIRSRVFAKPQIQDGHRSEITNVPAVLAEEEILTKVTGTTQPDTKVSLNDAAVVVSGGRGVANNPNLIPPSDLGGKSEEVWRAEQGFRLIGELAEVLGGAVGASRAAVDAGYIPYTYQVGQTGKLISPDLYLACGISGAIQHLAGMRTSKVIVAINKDADAPIFKVARFGVVGDLYDILPALTDAFRKRLG